MKKKISIDAFDIETVEVFDTRTALRILLTTFAFVGAFASVFPILSLDLIHVLSLILCATIFARVVIGPPTRVEFTEETAMLIERARSEDDEED